MKITKVVIKRAVEEAEKSNHTHRVGAVIFKNKSVISAGRNFSSRSAKHLHPRFMKWKYSIHAEADAIMKARQDLKGCSMFVVRLNKNGKMLMAKPCKICRNYLNYIGISRVYYTTNDSKIEELMWQ